MRCKNCGAEIGRKQAYCSYCGSENNSAYLHQQKIEAKKRRNKDLRYDALEKKEKNAIIANKVMTFVLLASVVFFVISIIISFVTFSQETGEKIDYKKAEKLYAAGEYGKLQSYIFDCDYYEEKNNKYMQAAEYYKYYLIFVKYRNRYIEEMQKGDGTEEYTIESMANYIVSIINPLTLWNNEEALGNNQELFDACKKDAEDFLRAYFDFTDEDIEALKETNEKSTYDIEDELEEKMKMKYYREKGYESNE